MIMETSRARNALPTSRRSGRGLTLVELIVVMAVVGVLMSFAVPSLTNIVASNRITSQTNELVAALSTAKSEAVRRGQAVSFRANDDANPNDFHRGWTSFIDADANGDRESSELVLRENGAITGSTTIRRVTRAGTAPNFTYPDATSSLTSRQFVTFNSRGNPSAGEGFFKICDSTRTQVTGRVLRVSVIGRVSIDATNENCTS